MRWSLSLSLALCLCACGAPEVQSQRLKDGSWQVQCELPMDECIRKSQDKCPNLRYRILEGTSETRLRDAPPFERAYHTSRLRLSCSSDGAEALITFGGKPAPVTPEVASPATASKPPVCTQGQTRECVGPAACKGGQACLADGSGFSACDCGASVPPTPAPEPLPSVPGPSSAAPAPAVP